MTKKTTEIQQEVTPFLNKAEEKYRYPPGVYLWGIATVSLVVMLGFATLIGLLISPLWLARVVTLDGALLASVSSVTSGAIGVLAGLFMASK